MHGYEITHLEQSSEFAYPASTLVQLLRWRASNQAGVTAYTYLVDDNQREVSLTYKKLDEQARAIAAYLQSIDTRGQRALLIYPPGLEYTAAFFGCLYAGVIAVPSYPPDRARLRRTLPRLQAVIKDAQATIALTTSPILAMVRSLFSHTPGLEKQEWLATDSITSSSAVDWREPVLTEDTLAFLQYTSGSTGAPKGVMLTHGNLLHNASLVYRALEHCPDDRYLSWLPIFHDMGFMAGILEPLYAGIPAVLMSPVAFLQGPERWLQAISRYKATISGGPNFAYDLCVRKISEEKQAALDLSSWRVAFNGAEPIRPETLDRFTAAFAACGFRRESFYPCYGLAEATLIVTGGKKDALPVIKPVKAKELGENRAVISSAGGDAKRLLVSCGAPLFDQKVVIVNPQSCSRCSPGEVGEIWVAGPSVAQGYWNSKEESERSFNGHFSDTGEGPFLRTGDTGLIYDGELFVTGRLKDLIIVRGLNHYPQDIERTVEECHPALRLGCSAAFSVEVDDEERVVVVQEAAPGLTSDLKSLIEKVREAVAIAHELQLYSVVLIKPGTISKTSSGKIQRHACRAKFLDNSLEALQESRLEGLTMPVEEASLSKEAILYANQSERRSLLEAYLKTQACRLLGVSASHMNVNEPLLKFGLDSLRAVELSADIFESLGFEITPVDLLSGPSITALANSILSAWADKPVLEGDNATAGTVGRVAPSVLHDGSSSRNREKNPPLSFTQQRLWFLDQLVRGCAFYNIPIAIKFSGPLQVRALEQSFREMIRRHETLRTNFVTVDGQPIQVIAKPFTMKLPVTDLSHLPDEARRIELKQLARQIAQLSFDLSVEPLMRASLIRTGAQEHMLLIVMHHIISDGWSVGVVMQELAELYDAISRNRPSSLAELPIQYADYAAWQREWLQEEELERHLAYWKQQLEGSSNVLQLRTDRPRPAIQTFKGAREEFELSKQLSEELKRLSRQEQATLFMTLLAVVQVLMYRYTGQDPINIGTATHNRQWTECRNLIGFFANTLVLCGRVLPNQSFRQLLAQVRETTLGALAHQDVPFEKLVEVLQPKRDLSHMPLFQVMFVLQNESNIPSESERFGGISLSRLYELEDTGASKRDLTVYMVERPEGMIGLFEYDTDLFDQATIVRMQRHFQTLLRSVVANPDCAISDLPLLAEDERRQLLSEWNSTETNGVIERCVHELFEQQVVRTPNAVALVYENEQLTYDELNRRANQLAHHLKYLGARPEILVGLCMERSLAMIVGMLGILKAGSGYVPFDPSQPTARLALMIEDCSPAIIVTQQSLVEILPQGSAHLVCLDTHRDDIGHHPETNLISAAVSSNLLYVLFTSGSTGRPKGIAVEHRQMVNYLNGIQEKLNLPAGVSFALVSTFAADLGNTVIFPSLCGGGTLHVISQERLADASALAEYFSRHPIDCLKIVPGHLRALQSISESERILPRKRLVLGGEASGSAWVSQLQKQAPNCEILNHYGPTEATVGVLTYKLGQDASEHPTTTVPLGKPISNTRVYILDKRLNPVPVSVAGELYISGDNLSRGYINRPDLTAERFIPDPFSNKPGGRIYKTGDLVLYLNDGNIEYIDRIDHQVKIRGFRLEVGEVEALLAQDAEVRESVVVARKRTDGDYFLVAYIVPQPGRTPDTKRLQDFLKQSLPGYMIPAVFLTVEALPRLENGKVNRNALLAHDLAGIASETAFVAPRSPVEELLAGIWTEVLGLGHMQISVTSSFFDLGGHSLLATQVISRVRDTFKVAMSLRKLFEDPTVAGLARAIEEHENVIRPSLDAPIQRIPRGSGNMIDLFRSFSKSNNSSVVKPPKQSN